MYGLICQTLDWSEFPDVPQAYPTGASAPTSARRELGGGGLVGMSEVKAVPLC